MGVGLIRSVEGLDTTNTDLLHGEGRSETAFGLQVPSLLPSLQTLDFSNLHDLVSQFLEINLSLYTHLCGLHLGGKLTQYLFKDSISECLLGADSR